jgi:hypothetical protein
MRSRFPARAALAFLEVMAGSSATTAPSRRPVGGRSVMRVAAMLTRCYSQPRQSHRRCGSCAGAGRLPEHVFPGRSCSAAHAIDHHRRWAWGRFHPGDGPRVVHSRTLTAGGDCLLPRHRRPQVTRRRDPVCRRLRAPGLWAGRQPRNRSSPGTRRSRWR